LTVWVRLQKKDKNIIFTLDKTGTFVEWSATHERWEVSQLQKARVDGAIQFAGTLKVGPTTQMCFVWVHAKMSVCKKCNCESRIKSSLGFTLPSKNNTETPDSWDDGACSLWYLASAQIMLFPYYVF